ncbi:MAG: hypothetical protein HY960_08125 [Ignavibacteriae bacterium]|nr:hypothetical protein [Ignavibacteriota bacterium]
MSNLKKFTLLTFLFLFIQGCATQRLSTLFNNPSIEDKGRINPKSRINKFEDNFRNSNSKDQSYPNYLGNYEGLSTFFFPKTKRPEAAWNYVFLGWDFLKVNDIGGAARAFWAGLKLVGTTNASRTERERIRYYCYQGLGEVAEGKKQHRYRALLLLCSDLINVYLHDPQSYSDSIKFVQEMAKFKSVQISIENAEDEKNKQGLLNMLNVLSSVYASDAQLKNALVTGDSKAAAEQLVSTFKTTSEANEQEKESRMKLNEMVEKLNTINTKEISSVVESEVISNESDLFFVSKEIIAFLAITDSAKKNNYLNIIHSFAEKNSELDIVLNKFDYSETAMMGLVRAINKECAKVEVTERRKVNQ